MPFEQLDPHSLTEPRVAAKAKIRRAKSRPESIETSPRDAFAMGMGGALGIRHANCRLG
jgi:hypothetical protein